MPTRAIAPPSPREIQLKAEFGELLSTADLARVLRYRTTQAVRKARLRGALSIPMQQLPGRRGWYATTRAVAAYLDALDNSRNPEEVKAPSDPTVT